ncbi:uncharacterized protein LOC131892224 isoform X1 [Tigriopus californicus]|uniref:uncharacterized protein LOC131892224 isoform X1 n=1 Tax=Tigriopus californicus TaxID=6832 RepID=UPI0027DA7409|nr:uncharacterized protein LOC131892224 isoform X1 [Tigriopus californicus]
MDITRAKMRFRHRSSTEAIKTTSLWDVLAIIALVLTITCPWTDGKPFPAWVPGEGAAVCAKFQYYYGPNCFHDQVRILYKRVDRRRGIRKLQVACDLLTRALGNCLKYFNELCSEDHLSTGRGDFTSASISPASRAALADFRSNWQHEYPHLNINQCVAYGGLCEHPKQLEYCGIGSRNGGNVLWLVLASMIQYTYLHV